MLLDTKRLRVGVAIGKTTAVFTAKLGGIECIELMMLDDDESLANLPYCIQSEPLKTPARAPFNSCPTESNYHDDEGQNVPYSLQQLPTKRVGYACETLPHLMSVPDIEYTIS